MIFIFDLINTHIILAPRKLGNIFTEEHSLNQTTNHAVLEIDKETEGHFQKSHEVDSDDCSYELVKACSVCD